MTRFILLLFFISSLFQSLFSQSIDSLLNNKRVYPVIGTGNIPEPAIDGILDDPVWSLGEWQSDFTQQQPYGGAKGTENTYLKIVNDFSNLYVAIICQDKEPEKIREYINKRDVFSGDMTGIAIDSYYDKRTAFEFNMSAAGQKVDLKHMGDYQWDMNWNGVWDGASARTDTGWVAEMKIPFSQLRYSTQEEHTWGIHVWRWIDRKREEDQWQYIPREAPAMVYLFGKMEGINNIRSSRQIEFLPYVLSSYNSNGDNPLTLNAGLDAKIGISSDYTLDLTINPDFGQVEADPSVLNLTAFETFYDEKRPFFLEGNEIFDFELDGDIPYYSRRIGSAPSFSDSYEDKTISDIPDRSTILSAAKFTGKSSKGLSLGLINGITASEHARYTDEESNTGTIEVAPLSNYLGIRLKQEFKEGNSMIGGFLSSVNRISDKTETETLLPSSSWVGGIDFLHQWKNRNYFIEGKAIASQLKGSPEAILIKQLSHNHRFQRPDAGHVNVDSSLKKLNGNGGLLRIGKKGGNWQFSGTGQYRSPGLNLNDMGYIRQSDLISQRLETKYTMNKPKKYIRNYTLELYQQTRWSFGKELTQNKTGVEFTISNLKLWTLHAEAIYHFSSLDTRDLRGGPALRNDPHYYFGGTVRSNSTKKFFAQMAYYHKASGFDNYLDDIFYVTATWRPMRNLHFSAISSINHEKYYQQYVTTLEGTNNSYPIVANIDRKTHSVTLRGEVFFSPEISLQYYGNPYFSSGKYEQFRIVENAQSKDFDSRFQSLESSFNPEEDLYNCQIDNEPFSFSNPDFSFMQYRSNLVFRWEYKLGSTLHLVWSHDRSDWQKYAPLADIRGDLAGLKGTNIFLIKFNYWFSV